MPRYDFKCDCGNTEERYVSEGEQAICHCGRVMARQFPLNHHFHVPHHMRAGNEQQPLYTPEEYRDLRDRGYEHADKVVGV
jgi:hypothetical protein